MFERQQIRYDHQLQNLSHIYYSHYGIIKFVRFEPFCYAINTGVSSSMIFSDLVSVFLSMYC